ncbi:hypothetical protein VIM7927_00233 [Vibrio mangrovi]|uniref:CDP-archaeol synthase n=2 Tax=Vibrio mangrovi TaxID=474394 RepID=A0A1Y6IPL8_9VIBR|nr:CDP-archaeol synthase [Vibrio mangrovi]MDW6004192.1 CDP-archaeol synthase [Vibrio mangrovi]SMR99011.1 hypothetical protein VIM7927_00233 [Vibrio mangrovi]
MLLNIVFTSFLLLFPLILSGSFHMVVVKRNWLSRLAIPISEKRFGRNKTWRGIVVMVVATIPTTYFIYLIAPYFSHFLLVDLYEVNPAWLGALLGLGYVIPELPNSYVKRRLNIPPGEPASKNTFWFSLIDQADSPAGCVIVYALMVNTPVSVLICTLLLGPLIHLVINLSLFSLGLRKQPV